MKNNLKTYVKDILNEMKNDPCWDGYEMVGKKNKNGKEVPNCVPKNESIKECDCENKENSYEEVEGPEYIYTLNSIVDRADELSAKMQNIEELPSWIQDKIAQMDNDMEDIYDYLMDDNEYIEDDDSNYENWDEEDLNEAHSILEKWGKLEWQEISELNESKLFQEAEYRGRKVQLGKIMAGDVKKFKVYVKNDKGNVVKVNFGQKGVKIKKKTLKEESLFVQDIIVQIRAQDGRHVIGLVKNGNNKNYK